MVLENGTLTSIHSSERPNSYCSAMGLFFNCGPKPEVLWCSNHFLVPSMKAQSSYGFNKTETIPTIHLNRLSQAQTGLSTGICWINDTLAIKHLSVFTDNKTHQRQVRIITVLRSHVSIVTDGLETSSQMKVNRVFLLQDSPEPSICSTYSLWKSHLSWDVSKQ